MTPGSPRVDAGAEAGQELPELVPIVFATVIVTVALYGLTATPVARRTRVAIDRSTSRIVSSTAAVNAVASR